MAAIGAVHVDVVPSTESFVREMRRNVLEGSDALGRELGQKIGKAAAQAVTGQIRDGINNGINNSDVRSAAGRQGQRAGDAFGRAARAEITRALSNLPDVDVDADVTGALADVGVLRGALQEISRKTLNVDIDAAEILGDISAIKALLASIPDEEVNVRLDYDRKAALAALGTLERDLLNRQRADVDRQSGFLASAIKKQLRAAVTSIPPVKIDANTDPARRKLEEFQAEARALLSDIDLNPDINVAETFAKIKALSTALRTISDNKGIDIGIRADAGKFLAQMKAISSKDFSVTAEVQPRIGAFREKVRAELEAARASLPSLTIDLSAHLDDKLARLAIDDLDQRLAHLNHDIRVGMNSGDAERELKAIEAEFEKLSHTKITPELEVDIRGALEHVRAAMAETGRRSGDVFGDQFKAALRSAFANLPDPRIDADFGGLRGELAEIKAEMSALSDVRIGVDISSADAFAKLRELQDRLVYLSTKGATVELRVAAAKAFADLETFLAEVNSSQAEVHIEGDIGDFRTKIVAAIEKAQQGLPEIRAGIDLTGADAELAEFRARLGAIIYQLKIDGDASAARRKLAEIMVEAKALLRTGATLEIKANTRGLITDLIAARAATLGVGAAFNEAGGGVSRMRLILAAVLLLIPLIAGAILALPAALSLVLLPIVAIVAGIQGIKTAFSDLGPQIDAIQVSASGAFQQTLAPGAAAASVILQGMVGPIGALSAAIGIAASDILTFVSSGEQLSRIQAIFTGMGPAVASMVPSIELLLSNFLRLTEIGLPALQTFGVQLERVGTDFQAMISRLSSTGVAQAAIAALFQVLSSLIGLIGPLTEIGAVMFQSFGPALSVAIDGIGAALSGLASFINMIIGALGPVGPAVGGIITSLILFRVTLLALGTTAPALFARIASAAALMGTGIGVAFLGAATQVRLLGAALTSGSIMAGLRGIAVTAAVTGRALLAAFGGPIGVAIIGVVVAMGLMGQAQAAADEQTAKLQSSLQALTAALDQQAGAINAITTAAADNAIQMSGAADAAKELGIGVDGLGESALKGGEGLEALKTRLQGIVDAGQSSLGAIGDLVVMALPFLKDESAQAADKAQLLLDALNGVGGAAVDVAAKQQKLVDTLVKEGASFINGVGSAKQYSDAVATLGSQAATTSDNVKALKDAIDALTDGFVSDQQALSDFEESIDKIPDALTKIKEEAKGAGNAVFTAAGQINQGSVAGRDFWDVAKGIADDVPAAAAAAYNLHGGFDNVAESAPAAAAVVQQARDAIIDFGRKAAGPEGAEAAAKLADSMGLIPSIVQILFENKNLPQVNTEMIELANAIRKVPGQKTIVISAPSETALKVFRELGLKIEAIPGTKDFTLTIEPGTLAKVDGVSQYITSQNPAMPITANAGPLKVAVDAKIAELQKEKRELPVGAKLEREALNREINALRSESHSLTFGADITSFEPTVQAAVAAINSSAPKIMIGGEPQPAYTALGTVLTAIASKKADVNIGGKTVPVDQALATVLANITSSNASVTIDGIDTPAKDVLAKTLAAIAQGKEFVTINGKDAPARDVLKSLLSAIGLSSESVTALLNDDAAIAALNALTKPRSVTITAHVVIPTTGTQSAPGPQEGMAAIGGIVKGYREGGIEPFATGAVGVSLRPMRGGLAQRVPANSWRVIGDRVRDDEAYIPINTSKRSNALLDYTAKAMGRDIAPLAGGGLLGAMASTANLAARLRKAALTTQTAGSYSGASSAAGAGGTFATPLGGDTKALEAKLDQIAGLLKGQGGSPITVEDKSGNPVETARAVQLALRLARR